MVAWLRVGLMILSQIIVTPIYLGYWSTTQYGIWLAVVAITELMQIPGMAHQTYVGNELLRYSNTDQTMFSRILKSGLKIGFAYGILELAAATCFALLTPASFWAETVPGLYLTEARIALVAMAVGNGLLWNWGGLWVRCGNAVGSYERGAWWGIADALVKIVAPLSVIPFGAGIATSVLAGTAAVLLLHVACIRDLRKNVLPAIDDHVAGEWRLGFRNFQHSLILSLRSVLDIARTTGTRLILPPLVGVAQLTAFATMRTGANAALQGLSTITNPLLPELMRFLNVRDQQKSEAAFGTVWMLLLGGMIPGVVILQTAAPFLFTLWTRNKIVFDPLLFGTLSLGVLVFAASQPAMAIATGNNLVRQLFFISLCVALLTIGGMIALVPMWGLRGAGVSLLAAEIFAGACFVRGSAKWLESKGMVWPVRAFTIVTGSVFLSTAVILVISLRPHWNGVSLPLFLVFQALFVFLYWQSLPFIARSKINGMFKKIVPSRFRPNSQSPNIL
jgi:O-antigen/teichoic acid export membrane protein